MTGAEYNGMRSVTLTEFDAWIQSNKNLTWLIGKDGGFWPGEGHMPLMKYIDLSLDTRDMTIFAIRFRGLGCSDVVSTTNQMTDKVVQENKFATILDFLSYKLEDMKIRHVCGEQGFDPMKGDKCPRCEKEGLVDP